MSSRVAVNIQVYANEPLSEQLVDIIGSNLNATKSISSSSNVEIRGSGCTVILNVRSGAVANLSIEGKSNVVIVNGGQCRVGIIGSGNTVDASASLILEQDVSGKSNCVFDASEM